MNRMSLAVTLLAAGSAFAETAPLSVVLEAQTGASFRCGLSHGSDTGSGRADYYLCGSGETAVILVRNQSGWQAVQRSKDQSTPQLLAISGIKNGDRTVYAQNPESGFAGNGATVDLGTKYRGLFDVLLTLDPRVGIVNGAPAERKPGTPDFEKVWSDFTDSAQRERRRISEKFQSSQTVSVEISNGQTVQCNRGKRAPILATTGIPDPGCELFSCPSVNVGGVTYDALLYQSSSPDSVNPSRITLSRKGALGPPVSVLRAYAGDVSPNSLLGQWFEAAGASSFSDNGTPNSLVPTSLSPIAGSLPQYFDSGWAGNRAQCRARCDSPEISRLADQEDGAFKAVCDTLAKTQTAQLISCVQGVFSSQLVPKQSLPPGACELGSGSYLATGQAGDVDTFQKLLRASFDQSVSPEEADRLFNTVSKMKGIPFGYLEDGCQARAHIIADRLEKMGVKTEKVWMAGDLTPVKDPKIPWRFHVAVVIQVKNSDGVLEKHVIDPSLASRPVSVEKWASLLHVNGDGPLTPSLFPPPSNSGFYQRATLSYSPSSIYLPYSLGGETMTAKAAMDDALATNAKDLSDSQDDGGAPGAGTQKK